MIKSAIVLTGNGASSLGGFMLKSIVLGMCAFCAFFLAWQAWFFEPFSLQNFVIFVVIGVLLFTIAILAYIESYRAGHQKTLNPNIVYEHVCTGYNYNVPVFTLKYYNIDKGWQLVEYRGPDFPPGFRAEHYPGGRICIVHENKGPLSNPI